MDIEEWRMQKAQEYCVNVTDGTHDSPKRTQNGRFLVTSKHIKGRNIDFGNAYFISQEDFDKINQRSKVDQWDVLISMIGEYCGFCYIERSSIINYAVKNVGIFKTGSKLKAEWLYYYLNAPEGRHVLENLRSGTSQPYISLGALRTLPIRVHSSLQEMERIVAILSCLDERIELNRKTNQTLEEMAQAIFRSWFVDFDPVRAKVDGQDPPGLAPHIADLFPNSFEESELGEIPKGWRVESLEAVCEFAYGKALKATDRRPGSAAVMGANGQVGWHDVALVAGPGIVVGRKGNPGIVTWVQSDFFPIDTTFYVVAKKGIPLTFLYHMLEGIGLANLGSDSAVPGLNRNIAYMSRVLLPAQDLLRQANQHWQAIFRQRFGLEQQNRTLVELRDALLPRLVSGDLRVPDAERILGRYI